MKRVEIIKGCCASFNDHINRKCNEHGFECPDNIVRLYMGKYSGIDFGLCHPDKLSYIRISHCPWCGANIEQLAKDSVLKE